MPDAFSPIALAPALKAYIAAYGRPDSLVQLQGIAGALVSVHQAATERSLSALEAETRVRQVVAAFQAQEAVDWLVDQGQQALAHQAHQWLTATVRQLQGVVNAYAQRFAPDLSTETVPAMAMAVLPLLKDRPVTRAEALALAEILATTFDRKTALQAAVGQTSLQLAGTLAIALRQKPLADAVTETVTAYIQQFEPTLNTVGETLIENALEAILRNRVDFNIDTHLDLANQQLLVEQVSFQINILQASPPPSRTAQEIAAQVHGEVQRFRAASPLLGPLDTTAGTLSPDGWSMSAWTADPDPEDSP